LFPAAARRVLQGVAWTQAQSEGDADALRRAGCRDVDVGGDLRGLQSLGDIEGVAPHAHEERNGVAFVSFHVEELPALVPMLREARNESPLIVFPRKPDEFPAFRKALALLGFVSHSEDPRAPRRIVDRFGLVGEALREVRVAAIGGSFTRDDRLGGHNLWEPMLAGCRVAVGPHHENQMWLAKRLRAAGLLRVIRDAAEWKTVLAERSSPPDGDHVAEEVRKARETLQAAAKGVRERLSDALNSRENAHRG
jgi:3-deoxy-D-manno-octulosonic-acid transferase